MAKTARKTPFEEHVNSIDVNVEFVQEEAKVLTTNRSLLNKKARDELRTDEAGMGNPRDKRLNALDELARVPRQTVVKSKNTGLRTVSDNDEPLVREAPTMGISTREIASEWARATVVGSASTTASSSSTALVAASRISSMSSLRRIPTVSMFA